MFKRILFVASVLCCISYSASAATLKAYIKSFQTTNDCSYQIFNFKDSSAYTGTHKSSLRDKWYYGDGTTDTGVAPAPKMYTTIGTFIVSLVVTDAADGLKDSTTKTFTISNKGVLPAYSEVGPLCERSEPKFSITSAAPPAANYYDIDFGDGTTPLTAYFTGQVHTYQVRGTYVLLIKDSTTQGCKSQMSFPIVISARPFSRNPKYFPHCQDSSETFVAFQQATSDTSGMHVTYSWRFPPSTTIYSGKTVTKLFKDSGNFNAWIILTNHTGNCNDSFSFNYTVNSNPKVNFYMVPHCQDSLGVIYDSTLIQFTSTSYPTSYTWSFCDSNMANCDTAAGYRGFYTPTSFNYGFPHGGTFYVTETVVSTDGCVGDTTKKVYINPTPTPNFTVQSTCLDSAVKFTDASTVPKGNSIVAWNWNFGDTTVNKQQSKLQDPAHEYIKPSYTYSVRLIPKTQAGCIDSIRENVVVYPLPVASYVFINECQGIQVPFANGSNTGTDTSRTNFLTHYVWLYGDGTPNDTVTSPLHAFKDSGYHNVRLVAFSSYGCSDTLTQAVYIYPLPRPSFVLQSDCERDSVKFINTSTSTVGNLIDSSFNWDFGDTTIAQFTADPKHLYHYSDTFNVKLSATTWPQQTYGCTKDTTISVVIIPGPHSADSIGAKCTGAPITFYNKTTSKHPGVIDYIWKFGDGTSDTASNQFNNGNVVHTYPGSGNYRGTLTSYMPATGCTDSIALFVPVTPRPVVFFRANNACNDSIVTCTDSSYVPGYARPIQLQSWSWDFGDGHFASGIGVTGNGVTHKYAAPGVYTIREYVTSNSDCEDSFIRQVTIYEVPVSKFSYVERCAGTPTPFTSLTTAADSVTIWSWVFSNDTANADSAINPTHIFQDNDILNASLTVVTANGCPNTKNMGIAIYTSPVSAFSYNLNCNNRPINFYAATNTTVQPPNYISSYHWDFGDTAADDQPDTTDIQSPGGVIFTHPGKYIVSLTEISNQGCVNIDTQVVFVPELPIAGFYFNGNCVGRQYEFIDTTQEKGGYASWDLGDNSGPKNSTPISHIYAQSGAYLVKMAEVFPVSSTLTCISDTAETEVVVNPLPFAKFSADTSCFGQPTAFYDSSKANGGTISSYSWSFGDKTIDSTNKSMFYHIYADSFQGSSMIYTAVLKISSNFGCDSSDTQKVFIRQIPYASFTANPDPAVIQSPQVTFTNTTQNADPAHYYWNFGDSTDSHDVSPTHTYKDTGTFIVTLATDNDFCQDTFRYIVYVTPGYTLYAPNCITVNGDGKNDVWMAKGVGVVDFDCVIMDRWGQQVFHSTDINTPWNADYNGNGVKVMEGVYVFSIKAGDFSSTNFTSLKGFITVLR